ncbi:MAG: response regulator [Desulforhopalus sp.]
MKKVLITDDEYSFLLSLQDGLTVHNDQFTIMTAGNGREAVEILEESAIDLLVTDLEMPQMNGFELLAWVSRELPQLPVIVMTAFGTPEIETRLAQFNTLQYLEKPLDLETLERAILAGLDKGSKSFIQGITPASFLQLLHLEKKSCTLKVTSKDGIGYLHLLDGELIDADFADLHGESAANRIVCWEKTEIEMDNWCQRQEGSIRNSLESILLNAHRLKDEDDNHPALHQDGTMKTFNPAEQEKAVPGKDTLPAQPLSSAEVQQLLITRISSHQGVSELALFDRYSNPVKSYPSQCSLHIFDPVIYLHLLDSVDENLGFGGCSWVCFHTARRVSFLLFRLVDHSLLVKLQKGARHQIISREIGTLINGTLTGGQQ